MSRISIIVTKNSLISLIKDILIQRNKKWSMGQNTWVKETMVLVTDVPMLEPIIIGMAVLNSTRRFYF